MGKPPPLTGEFREQLVKQVRDPLAVYLAASLKQTFTQPPSADALDMMTDAVVQAVNMTIGALPEGRAALQKMAYDILDAGHQPTLKK